MTGRTKEELANIDRSIKPELRNGSRTCQCAMCNLFFTGIAPFDRHLIGFTDRCRTPEQMREIGMVTNEHGVWMYGLSLEEVKAAKGAA